MTQGLIEMIPIKRGILKGEGAFFVFCRGVGCYSRPLIFEASFHVEASENTQEKASGQASEGARRHWMARMGCIAGSWYLKDQSQG
jgi:hypothetical protein